MRDLTNNEITAVNGGAADCIDGVDVLLMAGASIATGLAWAFSGPVGGIGATIGLATYGKSLADKGNYCSVQVQ
ncbi:MAG TPA: hypothetical protein VLF15_07005 [Pseudoxanthomonas sp.]|nr:hypothetical protein [Pseudoxanthomonas sp.]